MIMAMRVHVYLKIGEVDMAILPSDRWKKVDESSRWVGTRLEIELYLQMKLRPAVATSGGGCRRFCFPWVVVVEWMDGWMIVSFDYSWMDTITKREDVIVIRLMMMMMMTMTMVIMMMMITIVFLFQLSVLTISK